MLVLLSTRHFRATLQLSPDRNGVDRASASGPPMVGHPQGVMSLPGRHSIDRSDYKYLYPSNRTARAASFLSIYFVDVSIIEALLAGIKMDEINANAHGQSKIPDDKSQERPHTTL